ncbi:hypothetical protein MATL_G00132510 [Megalops atlanticus]|uniref:Uncharacterized protein n=1 Tax=Megalops atlanticus TaxID=7932 RepID=A0A9D3Q0C6_MEGAT|nr:hypothetical protein MATL_G00132510 [Megalops atlanticus]
MLYRNVLISCSLAVLLVKADLDTVSMFPFLLTGQDVPTESTNAVSSDQPSDSSFYHGVAGAFKPSNGIAKDGTTSSAEDRDEDQSLNSEEGKR